MSDDLFAPPTAAELAMAEPPKSGGADLFGPPTADELKRVTPPPDEGALVAAGSGVAHGLSFGQYDKLKAAAQAGLDKYQGAGDFGPQYDKHLAEQRQEVARLADQHPYAYHGAEIGSAILNPLNALIPGSGLLQGGRIASAVGEGVAGLAGNMIGGAGVGALQGAGESHAKPLESFDEAKKFASDIGTGAKYGAAGGAIGTAAGKALESIPGLAKKGASVLLGANEDAVGRYIGNKEAVQNAPTLVQSVDKVKDLLGSLKGQVGSESQASRKILDAPDATKYTGADIANFFASKIDDIQNKAQGVLTPEEKATVNYLKKYQDVFLEGSAAETPFTGSKIKDLIQGIDRNVKYGKMPGQFDAPDEKVLKSLRSQFNGQLRADSPQYAEKMDQLAEKSGALNNAQKLFKSDQGLMNTLNRVRRDRAPFAEDALNNVDSQFGTSTVEDLKNALARESLEKGAQGPGGSRNVQLYAHTLGDMLEKQHLPGGHALGAMIGGTVDKYGPSAARGGIDAYLAAKNMSMNPTVRSYLEAMQSGAAKTKMSPNINPAISQYLVNKYFGNP